MRRWKTIARGLGYRGINLGFSESGKGESKNEKQKIFNAYFYNVDGMCFVTACKPSAGFDLISNYTLTGMEVQENKILVEGRLHSSALIVDHYSSRIEGNAMYIKSTIRKGEKVSGNGTTTTEDTNNLELRKHLSIYFEAKLPNNIEKIFMEDSNHQIMIWEKDQGYGRFEIEDLWKEEVKKIKNKE